MTNVTEIAVSYASEGFKIFPCDAKSKKPLCRHGYKDATTDKQKIRRWWKTNPDALIGSVCDEQFTVIDVDLKNGPEAFDSLSKIWSYVSETNVKVNTLSGGNHYYFAYDEEITRKIKTLPSVDVLGRNGYVILPDGERYQCFGTVGSFIRNLFTLPPLNEDLKNHITGESILESLKMVREAPAVVKIKSGSEKEQAKTDEDAIVNSIREIAESQHQKLYRKRGKNCGSRSVEFNGEPIPVGERSMTTEVLNGLFHNKEVQKRLSTFMGVPHPSSTSGKSHSFRSFIPKHHDKNPSMGSRWNKKGDKIIVRDFSDYYGNGVIDYDLVQLYMMKSYSDLAPSSTNTFRYVWTMRMLEEAEVIKVQRIKVENNIKMTSGEQAVYEGFVRLMSYKAAWDGEEPSACYSQKFAKAWSGKSFPVINQAKNKMITFGMIEKSGSEGSGAMRTTVFKFGRGVIKREDINTIPKLINAVNIELRRKIANGQHKFLGKRVGVSEKETTSTPKSEVSETEKSLTISKARSSPS